MKKLILILMLISCYNTNKNELTGKHIPETNIQKIKKSMINISEKEDANTLLKQFLNEIKNEIDKIEKKKSSWVEQRNLINNFVASQKEIYDIFVERGASLNIEDLRNFEFLYIDPRIIRLSVSQLNNKEILNELIRKCLKEMNDYIAFKEVRKYILNILEVVTILGEHGADLNIREEEWDLSVLWYASLFGNETFIERILKLGANINEEDSFGNTLVHKVVEGCEFSDHIDVIEKIKVLMKFNVDLNKKNEKGSSPIVKATGIKYLAVAKFLINECNVELHDICERGRNILYYALLNKNIELAEMLFEKGLKIIKDKEAHTPLYYLVEEYYMDTLQLRLETIKFIFNKNLSKEERLYILEDIDILEKDENVRLNSLTSRYFPEKPIIPEIKELLNNYKKLYRIGKLYL